MATPAHDERALPLTVLAHHTPVRSTGMAPTLPMASSASRAPCRDRPEHREVVHHPGGCLGVHGL
jgi:hypothetical protein